MAISCRKLCDCSVRALPGLSSIALAMREASGISISLPMGSVAGVSVIFTAIVAAKIAESVFDSIGWRESTARSCAEWVFSLLCALGVVGAMLKNIRLVDSIASGTLCALRSTLMIALGGCGSLVLARSVYNLFDPEYLPSDWSGILHKLKRFPYGVVS